MEYGCLVSVIVPVYNVKSFLAEALESALAQTYKNIEIIVIDDGSTDGSGELCDEYAKKDGRIRVIHQQNRGLSGARNAGLHLVKGEAIAFLDSDDAYHPDFVSAMLGAMLREKTDIVICRYTLHETAWKMLENGEDKGVPETPMGFYPRDEALRALADRKINSFVWNKLYRRELWNGVRFTEGRVYEDIDITYKLLATCRDAFILDRALYLYRKRPGSITAAVSWKSHRDLLTAQAALAAFMRANTPGVFNAEQMGSRQRYLIGRMTGLYLRNASKTETEITAPPEEIRALTVKTGQEIGTEYSPLYTKISYRLLRSCPALLRAAYSALRFARRIRGKNRSEQPER